MVLSRDAELALANVANRALSEMICGPRPPLFRDFFDDALRMTAPLKRRRPVLEIRARIYCGSQFDPSFDAAMKAFVAVIAKIVNTSHNIAARNASATVFSAF